MVKPLSEIAYVGGLPQCLDCSKMYANFSPLHEVDKIPEGTTVYHISSSIDDTWTRPLFCSKEHATEYLSALTISEDIVS